MNIFTIGLAMIILAGISCWTILFFIFRRTFLMVIATIFCLVIDSIACYGYIVGQKGLIHLSWTVPFALISIIAAFYYLSARVKNPIQHLTKIIKLMSQKDMTQDVDQKYINREKYEIKEMLEAVDNLLNNNRILLHKLSQSSTQLLNSATHINSGAQGISTGATQQASGIEEISANIEQMTANINNNASNSHETEKLSSKSEAQLTKSFETIKESVALMNEINENILLVNDIAESYNFV